MENNSDGNIADVYPVAAKPKKYKKLLIIILIVLCILVISGLSFVLYVNRSNIEIPFISKSEDNSQENSLYESYLNEKESQKEKLVEKLSVSDVISKNDKYIVRVFCFANDGDVSATGVVIGRDLNENLIVLTNYHVIENLKTLPHNPSCMIVYEYDGLNENYYGEPVFWEDKISQEDMWLYDFAFLEVKNSPKIEHTFIDENGNESPYEQTENLLSISDFPKICALDKMGIGEELVVLGYPGISNVDVPGIEFTSVFTATEGIISEKVTDSDFYFNTSAKIDAGNSGGGAFLRNTGCLAGIPTFVVAGGNESMGKILNAYNLERDFLVKVLDINPIIDAYNEYFHSE